MTRHHTGSIVLAVLAAGRIVSAQSAPAFQPQAANVMGADTAHTPIPFTRVWTQMPGELSMQRMQERYVNLAPNWALIGRKLLTDPEPIVAYMNIAWGDEIIRVTCRMDRANSDIVRGHFRVVMRATEGTEGSVAVGTVVGLSDGYTFLERGRVVMTADVAWQPGVFPDVLPTSLTMTDQLVPGLWQTNAPGRVIAEHIFTSIPPADGSAPIVYTHRQEFRVIR
jgi:hypothetical protein